MNRLWFVNRLFVDDVRLGLVSALKTCKTGTEKSGVGIRKLRHKVSRVYVRMMPFKSQILKGSSNKQSSNGQKPNKRRN